MASTKETVINKVMDLVNNKFGGDWERAFDFYSARGGAPGLVELDETKGLLQDAGLGSGIGLIPFVVLASKVQSSLDLDGDDAVSKEEFRTALDTGSE